MTLDDYVNEIKLKLTGGVLELEISDGMLISTINACLRELNRYIDCTTLLTIPFTKCIDMKEYNPIMIVGVHRTDGFLNTLDTSSQQGISAVDPVYMAQWQIFGGMSMIGGMQNWADNYAAWSTSQQIRNTLSTDLAFRYDRYSQKLYVNTAFDTPTSITVEYIPHFDNVEQITSDFWCDVLLKMSLASVKIILGRIRSRYTTASSLWLQDGETMLNEGNTELADIREKLKTASQLSYTVD